MYFKHVTKESYTDWQHVIPMAILKSTWLKELGFWAKLILWIKG